MNEMSITDKHKNFRKSDLTGNEIEAIDVYLEQIAKWQCTEGVDSNAFEKEYVSLKIKALEQKIKIISEEFYQQINTPPRDYKPNN